MLKKTYHLIIFFIIFTTIPTPTHALSYKSRLKDVNSLINTLEKNYAYTWLKKVDWGLMRDKYLPLVETHKKKKEHYLLLTKILQELKDSHCKIIDPTQKERYLVGFKIDKIENKYLVSNVTPNSPAHKAGIQKGWELISINKIPVEEKIKSVKKHIMGSDQWVNDYSIELLATVTSGKNKSYFKTTNFLFKNQNQIETQISLKPSASDNLIERSYWQWQTEKPYLKHNTLTGNIGYIKINGFAYQRKKEKSISSEFTQIVRNFAKKNVNGIVIDLRDTNGGYGDEVCRMVSNFIPGQTLLRQTCFPKGPNCIVKNRSKLKLSYDYSTYPNYFSYGGPVVLITNSFCRSACDMFTAAFKTFNRAHIIGQQTAGAGGTYKCEKLPSGVAFCYTNWPVVLADGNVVEGVGVKPDKVLDRNLKDFYLGKDTLLDEAVGYLHKRTISNRL